MRSYSKTRWWSRWEVYEQLLTSSGDATPFVEQETTLAPTTRQRLLSITQDTQKNQKLQLELAAVIDAGDPFVRATYKLEGDGALVFDCFDVLSSLAASIQTGHFPNLSFLKPLDYSFLRKSWRTRCQCYQRSTAFPFLANATTLHHLKTELPEYLAKAQDVSINMAPPEWWNRQSTYLTG